MTTHDNAGKSESECQVAGKNAVLQFGVSHATIPPMGKWLNTRCCGISCYAIVMALLMGTLTWWLLPRYGHQHRWTLDGTALVQWIGKKGDIVVKLMRAEPHASKPNTMILKPTVYQLETSDGSMKQIDLKVDFSEPEFIDVGMKLQRRRNLNKIQDYGPLELRDSTGQFVELVPVAERILGERGMTEFLILPQLLRTAGEFAMSRDQRWLLLQHLYIPPWSPFREWLLPRWPALAKLLPTGNTHAVLLYDRDAREVIRLHPDAHGILQFIFDIEESRGFLVVDRPNSNGSAIYPNDSQSTLTWYSLPLRASSWKRYLTLGVACLPLLLSGLRHIRRRRRIPPLTPPVNLA